MGVFFLREKSETLMHFKFFMKKAENEFQRRIKCLRTNNRGYFISKEFQEFSEEHGIRRQFTYHGTS